jgi:hypothetical protein
MVIVPARQATQPGGVGSLEAILGLLKSLNSGSVFPARKDGTISYDCPNQKKQTKYETVETEIICTRQWLSYN